MNIEEIHPLLPFGSPPNWAELTEEQQQLVLEEQIKIKEWRERLKTNPVYLKKTDILDK